MKKIDINTRRKNKESRELCLGNGQRVVFTSKREAARFVAETNRYLTKVLFALNDTYIAVWTEYRRFWPMSANFFTGTRSNNSLLDNQIKGSLESADFMLMKFTSGSGSNDPYFAFIDLRKTCLFLKDAADKLARFYKERDFTANYHTCQMLADRCVSIMVRLDSWTYNGPSQKKIPG